MSFGEYSVVERKPTRVYEFMQFLFLDDCRVFVDTMWSSQAGRMIDRYVVRRRSRERTSQPQYNSTSDDDKWTSKQIKTSVVAVSEEDNGHEEAPVLLRKMVVKSVVFPEMRLNDTMSNDLCG